MQNVQILRNSFACK